MTKEERISMLEEAQGLIAEALELIRETMEGDDYVEAYLCTSLSLIIDEGIYVSGDLTIQTLIDRIKDGSVDEANEEIAHIDDERGRGYGNTGEDRNNTGDPYWSPCCGSSSTAPPCPACGERVCQDCEGHHVCDPE